MAAIVEAISAPPLIQATAGVVLICDQSMTASPLVERCSARVAERALYTRLTTAILQHCDANVILHSERRFAGASAIREDLHRSDAGSKSRSRLRVIEAEPLASLLPGVDFLVSFASPALIQGCRRGLKPIQIGRAIIGSAAFSHVLADIDSFVEALASRCLVGRLSLREYEEFEDFCRRLGGDSRAGRGWWNAWRQPRDPIIGECLRSASKPASITQTIASAVANPIAVWRLLGGNFPRTGAPSSPTPPRIDAATRKPHL